MAALTKDEVKALIVRTRERYEQIEHEQWDPERSRYRMIGTAMWEKAAKDIAPPEWVEIVRVCAQGESYYGGMY